MECNGICVSLHTTLFENIMRDVCVAGVASERIRFDGTKNPTNENKTNGRILSISSERHSAEHHKVVFCRVRTEPYPGYLPRGYYPTKIFCKLCRTFIPVSGTSRSSVGYSYP